MQMHDADNSLQNDDPTLIYQDTSKEPEEQVVSLDILTGEHQETRLSSFDNSLPPIQELNNESSPTHLKSPVTPISDSMALEGG